MNKASLGLFTTATLIAAPLTFSACSKPLPPTKTAAPISSASISNSASAEPPTVFAEPKKGPRNNEEFVANMVSCEATVNAHFGYMNSLRNRLGADIIDLNNLPCNIVLDIHGNVSRIIESCSQVIEPDSLFFDLNPVTKTTRALIIEQSDAARKTAEEIRRKIEKYEKRCFPATPKLTKI
ncbi:hypothetical protein IT411_03490 [Candidatus Peregrinibacteria bacterium]|nr:hypothetical protein [Candidatus Peregrinibacteria bacterium]